MDEEQGDRPVLIAHRHIHQRADTDPHCALRSERGALVAGCVPHHDGLAVSDRVSQAPEGVKPVSACNAGDPRCRPVVLDVDGLGSVID